MVHKNQFSSIEPELFPKSKQRSVLRKKKGGGKGRRKKLLVVTFDGWKINFSAKSKMKLIHEVKKMFKMNIQQKIENVPIGT